MVQAAAEMGLTPAQAWELTPREFALYAQGRARLARATVRRELALIWHLAALLRAARLPTLADFLDPPRPPTPEELVARAREHGEMAARMAPEARAK